MNQPEEKRMYILSDKFYEDPDKVQVFIHEDNEKISKDYNSCIESCSKDIKEIRFELEFQMREF